MKCRSVHGELCTFSNLKGAVWNLEWFFNLISNHPPLIRNGNTTAPIKSFSDVIEFLWNYFDGAAKWSSIMDGRIEGERPGVTRCSHSFWKQGMLWINALLHSCLFILLFVLYLFCICWIFDWLYLFRIYFRFVSGLLRIDFIFISYFSRTCSISNRVPDVTRRMFIMNVMQ